MDILVIAETYPSEFKKSSGLFVHKLMLEFYKDKHNVKVISPRSIHKNFKQKTSEKIDNIDVYYPKYISIPIFKQSPIIIKVNLMLMSYAVSQTLKKMKYKPDIIYSHFAYPSGVIANHISNENSNTPFVLSLGESNLFINGNDFYNELIKKTINSSDKVICVSNKLFETVKQSTNLDKKHVYHIPNGVDLNLFKKISKNLARKKLGLPLDKKLIAFVGSINSRKGFDKVLNVIKSLNSADYKLIIASSGNKPKDDTVIFCKQIQNNELHVFLSAADVFLFPTNAEGMSNAILEAMACKLPVITSDLDFNREFLTNNSSFLIDINSEIEIRKTLLNCLNENQDERVNLAYDTVTNFSMKNRYQSVLKVMTKIKSE